MQTFPHLIGLALCEERLFRNTDWTSRPVGKGQHRLTLCEKNAPFSLLNDLLPYWTCLESVPILMQQTMIQWKKKTPTSVLRGTDEFPRQYMYLLCTRWRVRLHFKKHCTLCWDLAVSHAEVCSTVCVGTLLKPNILSSRTWASWEKVYIWMIEGRCTFTVVILSARPPFLF